VPNNLSKPLANPAGLAVRTGEASPPPLWHTLALVALLLGVAAVGTLSSFGQARPPVPEERIVGGYLPLLVVNVSLALYVARVGRGRNALGELVGRRWQTARRALTDAALALLAAALIVLTEYAWAAAFGAPDRAWSDALLPTTSLERAAWVVVAVIVGTSEELVYRGYLQNELGVLVRSRAFGLLAQSALFAIAHGQQGASAVARTFVYGMGFGLLARARRSLLPGMLAHGGLDLTAGLIHH
jgi:membrane protease YdiL (CAAX protease family)